MKPEQYAFIMRFLMSLPGNVKCPMCRQSDPRIFLRDRIGSWTILDMTAPTLTTNGVTARHIQMRCEVCFFLWSFDADAMGVPPD